MFYLGFPKFLFRTTSFSVVRFPLSGPICPQAFSLPGSPCIRPLTCTFSSLFFTSFSQLFHWKGQCTGGIYCNCTNGSFLRMLFGTFPHVWLFLSVLQPLVSSIKSNISLQATNSRKPLRKQTEGSLSEIRGGLVLYSGYKKLLLNHGERFYKKTPNDFLQTLLEDDSF